MIPINIQLRQVLIISASVGAGHDQAGYALKKEIQQRYPNVRTEFVDFMDSKYTFNNLLKEVYLEMLECAPRLYNFVYKISARSGNSTNNTKYVLFKTMQHHMKKLFAQYQPDLVIGTHPFPCGAAARIRRSGGSATPLAAIVTDFSFHNMWFFHEIDEYFVATEDVYQAFAARGMSYSRVHVTGIPIKQEFGQNSDVTAIRQKWGLSVDKPLVLLMGGGLGLGAIEEALVSINELAQQVQVVAIAGKNNVLYDSLLNVAGKMHQPVKVLGFVDNISELMAVSDILITKPGGMTISEAMAIGLPMVFYKSLPGQEKENSHYLTSRGIALEASSQSALVKTLGRLLADPKQLHTLRERSRKLGHPHSAKDIIDILNSRIGNFVI
ncbi:MAG: ugtP 1 [Firmicutes bacterium]|nr:ugtP 1 [Bacillota bacterium]